MNYDEISSNDDDLFNEIPSSSFKSQAEENIDTLLNSLNIDTDQVDAILFRAKVVTSLLDSSHSFIYETNSYNRAIFNTLNSLTNGQFQYNLYAETLEETIFRRLIILEFLDSCTDKMDENILSFISKVTKTTIDSRFINTYFNALKNILQFSIDYNVSLYHELCQSINRHPIDFDVNLDSDVVSSYISSNSYINNVFTNIRKSLGFGTNLESN